MENMLQSGSRIVFCFLLALGLAGGCAPKKSPVTEVRIPPGASVPIPEGDSVSVVEGTVERSGSGDRYVDERYDFRVQGPPSWHAQVNSLASDVRVLC